ncbi:hypothetical protein [Desulfosoma sp.]|uniref:hypothetical protein n=1 Tax=Desulfosoma sp. TaxID=2603217 RepID=UPI004049F1D9
MFEEVSVSTAPWALGGIQRYGLAGLDFDAFQAGVETLKDALKNFRTTSEKETSFHLSTDEASVGEQPMTALPLTPNELSALLDIFHFVKANGCAENTKPKSAAMMRKKP